MPDFKTVLNQLQRDRERAQNEVKRLDEALASIGRLLGRRGAGSAGAVRGRRRMSAAGRARIAAAQRARWAKLRGKASKPAGNPAKHVRKISQAARNKMAAAQRARWAKVRRQKAQKKSAVAKSEAGKA